MKKLAIFSTMWLLLAGCSNREPASENRDDIPSESSFMSIRIVAAGSPGSRAEVPEEQYKDGEVYENYVNEVRFFFFNEDGSAARVFKKDGANVSYYDWALTASDNNGSGGSNTVEKVLTHTLTFRVAIDAKKPTQVLAVLNPTAEIKALQSPSLDELSGSQLAADYEGFDNTTKKLAPKTLEESKKAGFVMSNTVYMDHDGKRVNTTDCTGKFYSTSDEAKGNAVVIYVERVLARIDLSIDIPNAIKIKAGEGENDYYYIYPTGTKNPVVPNLNEDIYVRFLGWNVFDTPSNSNLIKDIDVVNWTDENLFGWSGGMRWNTDNYHRSFWAISPENIAYRTGAFTYKKEADNDDFNETGWTADHNRMPNDYGNKKYITDYFQENAAPYKSHLAGPTKTSKVIIAAQLVNKQGVPQPLAKWGTITGTVEGLKNTLAQSLNLWKKGETSDTGYGGTKTQYTHIGADDIVFTEHEDTYKLSVGLKEPAAPWYKQITPGEEYELLGEGAASQIVEETYDQKNVKVWTNGYAYYYFVIRHLGEKEENPGYYGVVRNHIYDAHVSSVDGIGIPVYDPEKDIVETAPTEEDWFLSATVNILQWRVVRHDYDLSW